eukprot:3670660-Rhodomonas_salina.3
MGLERRVAASSVPATAIDALQQPQCGSGTARGKSARALMARGELSSAVSCSAHTRSAVGVSAARALLSHASRDGRTEPGPSPSLQVRRRSSPLSGTDDMGSAFAPGCHVP